MIAVDDQQHVGAFVGEPVGQRREVFEDECSHRNVTFVLIESETDGWGVRGGDASNDPSHTYTRLQKLIRTVGAPNSDKRTHRQSANAELTRPLPA